MFDMFFVFLVFNSFTYVKYWKQAPRRLVSPFLGSLYLLLLITSWLITISTAPVMSKISSYCYSTGKRIEQIQESVAAVTEVALGSTLEPQKARPCNAKAMSSIFTRIIYNYLSSKLSLTHF